VSTRSIRSFFVALGLLLAVAASAAPARADEPVVHAVLFYSPTCPHCEQVISVDLPPLVEKHGDQLQIVFVNVRVEEGAALYDAAVARFGLQDRRGVPTLIVAETALVGSAEIPARLPALVDELLAAGGADVPDVPGLVEALAAASAAPASPPSSGDPAPAPTVSASLTPAAVPILPADGPLDRLGRDAAGNAVAFVVLAGMLVVLAWACVVVWRAGAGLVARPPSAVIPVLAIIGLGVAGYLAFVETAGVDAVCGPVGDCNTVQQSDFARLFGLVPIGVLGLGAYVAILVAWLVGARAAPPAARFARLALLGLAFGGVGFSVYLTFLEPFVIGATCAWCLTSAVLITGILVAGVRSMAAATSSMSSSVGAP
jgi:uncharacterized membrane protein